MSIDESSRAAIALADRAQAVDTIADALVEHLDAFMVQRLEVEVPEINEKVADRLERLSRHMALQAAIMRSFP